MRTVELKIEDIAFGGKGVGRANGKAIFVPFTIDGETVSAKIVREKKQFGDGELVALREQSPHRVKPECPYFGECGGCAYQHIDYAHQLDIKARQVRDVLQRLGKIASVCMSSIIPSPANYAYRNRITVHARDGIVGYFRRDSGDLIDIEACPIAMPEVNHELLQLRNQGPGDGHYTLRARSGPRVFTQTNDTVAGALRDLIMKLVPANQNLLVDAFCGAGFFAKALVDRFERVIGIDWDRFAIAAAMENATAKETYVAGDVEEELTKAGAVHRTGRGIGNGRLESIAPTLIVDPPSTGLSSTVRQAVVRLSPSTLIYVSCNPATLARDLKDLQSAFEITSVTPLDMFPQTAEIEVVAHLQRFGASTI